MTTMAHRTRITLSPEVTRHVFHPQAEGELARLWIRYLKGLLIEDGFDLENVAAPDARCIDLEMAGYPAGIEGLRLFRDERAQAMPDQRVHVLYMTVCPERATIEAVLRCTARRAQDAAGERPVSWDVRTLTRFENGLMVERWDRAEEPVLRGAA